MSLVAVDLVTFLRLLFFGLQTLDFSEELSFVST